jgi:cysteinyl-tRNA synthetase
MKLFNSLSRKLEEFEPINKDEVKIYTCGPTVYSYVTIGNWRTYFLGDLLVRALKYLGYKVKYVMNLTDVGHLTGDNLGDADTGEDRLEKAATKEGKTAWDVAEFYTKDFLNGFNKLNLTKPLVFCKATDHIDEQIELVKKIEEKGFSYKISDGIYFDTRKYEEVGNKYGELSNLDEVKEGARVEKNPEKKDPRDFALWKFSYENGRSFDSAQDDASRQRHMEWESPWGVGFPGWHIECSAMSMKYLGEQLDIHIGGEDLKSTHHPNEIAQSECVTGKKPFSKYWLHGAFLQVDGGRMGKSLGNAYTLGDIEEKGFKPEHLRYFYLMGYYRKPLNFTWESLESAKVAYERLVKFIGELGEKTNSDLNGDMESKFKQSLESDLNGPEIIKVVWEMMRSELSNEEKLRLILKWDEVLGFGLKSIINNQKSEYIEDLNIKVESSFRIEGSVLTQIKEREIARRKKDWGKSDRMREELEVKGFRIKDREGKVIVEKI